MQDLAIPSLREALESANGRSDDSAGYTEVDLAADLMERFLLFEAQVAGDDPSADQSRALPRREDALAVLIAPMIAEKKRRDKAASDALDRAHRGATRTGAVSLVVGLLLGGSVVWAVNSSQSAGRTRKSGAGLGSGHGTP